MLDRIKANDASVEPLAIFYSDPKYASRPNCLTVNVFTAEEQKNEQHFTTKKEVQEFLDALEANDAVRHVKLFGGGFQDDSSLSQKVVVSLAKRKKIKCLQVDVYPGFASSLHFLLHSLTDLQELELHSSAQDYAEAVGESLERHPCLRRFKLCIDNFPDIGDLDRDELEWEVNPVRNGIRKGLHDALGKALVSIPNLKDVEVVQCYSQPAFSARILESLLSISSVLERLSLNYVRFNDDECEKLATGLCKASSLVSLTMSIHALSDEAYAHLIESFHHLENLQELELLFPNHPLFPTSRVGLASAVAMYRYLKQATTFCKLIVRHVERKVTNDAPDYMCYVAAKILSTNRSVKEMELCTARLDSTGYNDLEQLICDTKCPSASLRKQRCSENETHKSREQSVSRLLGEGLALNDTIETLILDDCTIMDDTLRTIVAPLEEGNNTTLKTLGLNDEHGEYSEGSMTVDGDTLVHIAKSCTSLESITGTMHSFRWDPRGSLGFTPRGYDPERVKRYTEEIEGWLLLNMEGRRGFLERSLSTDAAISLLDTTKENTHCAFGLLRSKPDAFFV